MNSIDTADPYGPFVADELIAEALYPYAPDLVIATKADTRDRVPAPGRRMAGPIICAQVVMKA